MIRPYNPMWPRHFDLAMPSLSLISKLTPDKQISFLKGNVTGRIADQMKVGESITTPLGGEGKVETDVSKSLKMNWGRMHEEATANYTIAQLHKDLVKGLGQYRFNTSIVGIIYPVKGILADTDRFPALDGVEQVHLIEQSSGNYVHTFRRQLGVRVDDPFRYLAHKIIDKGIMPRKDFTNLHIRSIVGTRAIVGLESGKVTKGYNDLYPNLPTILSTIKGRKFWELTATPRRMDNLGTIFEVNEQEIARDGLERIAFGPTSFPEP